jgi:hypothetical protein
VANPLLDRRAFLTGLGVGAGWLAARGLGAPPSSPVAPGEPAPFAATLRALAATLSPLQRAQLVLPADHPSRQIDNTIAVLDRPHLGTLLRPAQRDLVAELARGMLSPRGREAFAGTFAVEGRFDGCVLALYGEPESGAAHAVLSGGHVLLRGGGTPGATAFGGGVAWGHQIGNHRWRVEGNSFAFQGDAANHLYAALEPAERERAVQAAPPHELVLQPQGSGGRFPGVALGSLGDAGREAAAALLDALLAPFAEPDARDVRACLDVQGGSEALRFVCFASHGFYEDLARYGELAHDERARRGDPYWQVWRLEGPGAVVHFQGYPHVHAYLHVARDPARANVGAPLGHTKAGLEGEPLRGLLEAALRRATGESLAWHSPELPGRFCPGEVTEGLAFALDPYGNRVAVATIDARAMAEPLRERLAAAGAAPEPGQRYRVATTNYFASRADQFGTPERVDTAPLYLREALVAHLRADPTALDSRATS